MALGKHRAFNILLAIISLSLLLYRYFVRADMPPTLRGVLIIAPVIFLILLIKFEFFPRENALSSESTKTESSVQEENKISKPTKNTVWIILAICAALALLILIGARLGGGDGIGAAVLLFLIGFIAVAVIISSVLVGVIKKVHAEPTVSANNEVQPNKNSRKINSTFFSIILLLIIAGLVYNTFFTIDGCGSGDIKCKYHYWHSNPYGKQPFTFSREECFLWYVHTDCIFGPAILYHDRNFCNKIIPYQYNEFYSVLNGTMTIEGMQERCKKWVDYYTINDNSKILLKENRVEFLSLSERDPPLL